MANESLSKAKEAKNDEFYTQYHDIEKEISAYLEYNPDVFRGKTVLLPCDDPEWSNFTFRNITCVNSARAVDITGLKALPVHNLLFDGIKWYGTREGMSIDYAEKISFQNCTMSPQRENTIKHSSDIKWNGKALE